MTIPRIKLYFLILGSIILIIQQAECKNKKPRCSVCSDITEKFLEGFNKTAKSNFGGGNTHWEEKSLGSYQFSETRFIEITENLCTSSDHDCHNFIEEYEEQIEHWWFKLFAKGKDRNLLQYLCVNLAKVCCHPGAWGPDCQPCPGKSERPCNGNGKCNGAGTREGSGKCDCDSGYEGDLCDECKEGYYESFRNDSHLSCEQCHTACDGGCHKEGPDGCHDCKSGWRQNSDDACEDVDECQDDVDHKICPDNKFCRNSPGSYECEACDSACQGCTGFGHSKCVECKENYYKDGDSCKACHASCESSCNGPGPQSCDECRTGYVKNEGTCEDLNECEADTSSCAANQYCVNIIGSFTCTNCAVSCRACTSRESCTACAEGYQMNPESSACQDVDECLMAEKVCEGEREKCVNTEGSFNCVCMKGYIRRGNKCERKQKVAVTYDKQACEICTDIVKNFQKGIEKTDKQNFGGGNTQWEEKKLGVYATSETRLVEITEELCTDHDKDCNRMMEHNEKFLEQWWFNHFSKQKDTDLFTYFCVNRVEGACCPDGTFGPTCSACPGGDNICSGRGKCDGTGTREGSGKCECDDGYTGETCSTCDSSYYEDKSTDTFTCRECDQSCEDSCSGEGPKGCDSCKTGWDENDTEGCIDIDECAADPMKCKDNQYCSNTVGSYTCEACNSACVGCTGGGSDSCQECAKNYYREEDSCKECHAACEGCSGGGPDHCTECRSGWIQQDNACADVNECQAYNSPCRNNQYCVNNLGSYRCHGCHSACDGCIGSGPSKCSACASGFMAQLNGDETSCVDEDECSRGTVCLEEGQTCSNTVGSYKCSCADGYVKKDDGCVKKKDTKKKKKKPKRVKNAVPTETEEEKEKKIDDMMKRIDVSGTPEETAAKIIDMVNEDKKDEL